MESICSAIRVLLYDWLWNDDHLSRRRQRPNDKWYQVNFLRGEWKVQILRSDVETKNNWAIAIFIKAWELIEKWVKC